MIYSQAEKIIKNHVILAIGISAIPIPMIDLILIYGVQKDMLKQLSRVYGKSFYEMKHKAYISVLATTSFARIGSSLIKTIPGVGSIIGGVSSAVMNGATTYALGKVTAKFFHDDIELSDVDMDLAKSIFKEELEKGKAFASNLVKQRKKEKESMGKEAFERKEEREKTLIQKLVTLKKLRDDDLITEEEYETKRQQIIEELGFS